MGDFEKAFAHLYKQNKITPEIKAEVERKIQAGEISGKEAEAIQFLLDKSFKNVEKTFGKDTEKIVQREFMPTSETSAITGEPIKKPSLIKRPESTSFLTDVKQGFVDDPQAKIKLYADSRFPNLPPEERYARYGIVNGEIVFVADDGKLYPEESEGFMQAAKRGVARLPADAPGIVMSGIGATAGGFTGPVAAGIGAAGGEAYRKIIGGMLGEEQTSMGNIADIGTMGAIGAVSELPGVGVNASRASRQLSKLPSVKYAPGSNIDMISAGKSAAASAAEQEAAQRGLTLLPHQSFDDRRMESMWKYLRQHPDTANAVQQIEDKMANEAETSFLDYVTGNISPDSDPWNVGTRLSKASDAVVEGVEKARTKAVGPYYDQFRKSGKTVDVTPVIDQVDTLLSESKDLPAKLLGRVKKILQKNEGAGPNMREFFKEHGEKNGLTKEYMEGYLKKYGDYGPEDRFMALDEAKKAIDNMLDPSNPESAGIEKTARFKVEQIRKDLVEILKQSDPNYGKALKIYEDMSPEIDSIKQGVIGRIGNLRGERVNRGVDMLFSGELTPEVALRAKNLITKYDPTVFNDALYTHMLGRFNKFGATESGKINNVAGKIYKEFFGSPQKVKAMKTLMTPWQFNNFSGLMESLRRAGIGYGKESNTAFFQETTRKIERGMGSKALKAISAPVNTLRDMTINKWNDIIISGKQAELLEALLDKGAVKKISQLKGVSPKSEKFYKILSSVLTVKGGQDIKREAKQATWEDFVPESVSQFNLQDQGE